MALPSYASFTDRLLHYGTRVLCGLVLLYLVLPILVVLPLSFNEAPFFQFPIKDWSFRWYEEVMNGTDWRQGAINSAIVAGSTTVLATILGTCAAMGLSREDLPFQSIIMAALLSPMIVPIVVIAVSVYFFFANVNLVGTMTGLVLGHTVLAIPFVVISVLATLAGFDANLTKAAASLGAGPMRTFFRVTLPQISPGVVTGALFAFVTSLDEVVIALFIAGPEQQTLPRVMWKTVREDITPAILAIACLLVFLSLLALALFETIRRRSARNRGLQP